MKDRDFLIWIHERLVNQHKEKPLYDYMHKLRAIIANTPANIETLPTTPCNSIEELQRGSRSEPLSNKEHQILGQLIDLYRRCKPRET